MLRDARHIAEAYNTVAPATKPTSVPSAGPMTTPAQSAVITPGAGTLNIASVNNEETKKDVKDWIRLEPGLCPIDTIRKADHTAHTILQFIYSICASPDAVNRVLKTINKAYKQDHK